MTEMQGLNTLRPFGLVSSSECDFDLLRSRSNEGHKSERSYSVLSSSIFVVQQPLCTKFIVINLIYIHTYVHTYIRISIYI